MLRSGKYFVKVIDVIFKMFGIDELYFLIRFFNGKIRLLKW